ncbi:MAG: GNAT family N-acetyltransferase [Terracidiphilus sp.]
MTSSPSVSLVEKLAPWHQVERFRCGKNSLDLFLRRHALGNQGSGSSQTYVVHRENVVLGYYSLVFGSIRLEDSPASVGAALPPRYPVPAMVFARFAVDRSVQRLGIGKALLKDAFLRTLAAAEIAGLAAILVDAIDDKMVTFYEGYGFEKCPGEPRKLMIPIRVVRDHLAPAAR